MSSTPSAAADSTTASSSVMQYRFIRFVRRGAGIQPPSLLTDWGKAQSHETLLPAPQRTPTAGRQVAQSRAAASLESDSHPVFRYEGTPATTRAARTAIRDRRSGALGSIVLQDRSPDSEAGLYCGPDRGLESRLATGCSSPSAWQRPGWPAVRGQRGDGPSE